MNRSIRTLLLLSGVLQVFLFASPVLAKQYGLVVGVDQYQYGGTSSLPNLDGAKNDALVISKALRKNGISLPDESVLLDKDATLANFKKQWSRIVNNAKLGDSIIFTFAGHGGQEKEFAEPYDEQGNDNFDETLMFHDFDPKRPSRGRISDDELFSLFEKASKLNVLFVADSCHSGGLVRAIGVDNGMKTRATGRVYEIPDDEDIDLDSPDIGDQEYKHDNVTMITATDSDSLKVQETSINGRAHGALSWYFADAIGGAADQNSDGILTRKEMGDYISEKVATHMERTQVPKLLPRGNSFGAAFSLSSDLEYNAPDLLQSKQDKVRVKLQGINLKRQLQEAIVVTDSSYQILLQASAKSVLIYNHIGDHIATTANDQDALQKIVDKYRLLNAIGVAYNEQTPPVDITLKQGDRRHPRGANLNFSFSPVDDRYRAFVLFNLAGDGTLQFLYPTLRGDRPIFDQDELPYRLALNVGEPFGSDNLIAMFCKDEQHNLKGVLAAHNNSSVPEPINFLNSFSKENCQIGRYAFFTEDG